jgi:hypothetical protein
MSVVVVVISQHLLNVFVQLANKRGLKKKKFLYPAFSLVHGYTKGREHWER